MTQGVKEKDQNVFDVVGKGLGYYIRCPYCNFNENKIRESELFSEFKEYDCRECGKVFLVRYGKPGIVEVMKIY